jgi:hypothetical protein
MNVRNSLLPLLAGMLLAVPALADEGGKTLPAVFTSTPPVIDGLLDDAAWLDAPLITDFHQVEPEEFGEPSERTEVWVLYDRDNLYVGARLHYSDMARLTANIMTPRQRVWSEDRLYVVLDPFLDRRNGYLFESNAHGIQGDALLENNIKRINEWSGVWQVETRSDKNGWSVEFKIPFATVSFDPQQANWGFNVLRDIKKTQERIAWSSQGRQNVLAAPSAAGVLEGLTGLKQGVGLDLIPSLSLRDFRDHELGRGGTEWDPSLDVTYRLSPSLTAKLTLNTDFSATEADDRQLNLTRFSLFFPEKRNFFLQDAGIFEFGNLRHNGRPFFSRTIGLTDDGEPLNLNAGIKLTGRVKGWNLGFLGVQQESSALLGRRDLLVGRAVFNLFEESSAGFIFTDGDPFHERDARTIGADFRYRNSSFRGDQILQAQIWYQKTDNDVLQGEEHHGAGDAWGVRLQLPNDRHLVHTGYFRFDRGFDPAMGFVNRNGIGDFLFEYRFRHRPETGYWRHHDHLVFVRRTESTFNRERSHRFEITPWFGANRHSDTIWFYARRDRELLEEPFELFDRIVVPVGDYEFTRYGVQLESAGHRKLKINASLESGDFLDGSRDTFKFGFEWKPRANFNVVASYSSNDVKLPVGAFTARIFSLKSEIAFSNRWSFIPLFQFDNVSEELGVNLRLRWHPRRGSDFFLVWNRNMQRDLNDRFETTFQESVVKVMYTFRF